MLLHGPPGTGKTLMARQIGKLLNGREPKVWLCCSTCYSCLPAHLRKIITSLIDACYLREKLFFLNFRSSMVQKSWANMLEKQRKMLETCLLMLRMIRGLKVANFTYFCVTWFCFVSFKHSYIWLFPGDASELHVIIFDEIDAICKVHSYSWFFLEKKKEKDILWSFLKHYIWHKQILSS